MTADPAESFAALLGAALGGTGEAQPEPEAVRRAPRPDASQGQTVIGPWSSAEMDEQRFGERLHEAMGESYRRGVWRQV